MNISRSAVKSGKCVFHQFFVPRQGYEDQPLNEHFLRSISAFSEGLVSIYCRSTYIHICRKRRRNNGGTVI